MGISPTCPERWSTQVEFIRLLHPLSVKISKGNQGYDVFCKNPQLVGSGNTLALALEMFFDHLLIDYYEHSLNPGEQTVESAEYGKKLRKFFNAAPLEKKRLVDFHES